jgi:hypothetical protein
LDIYTEKKFRAIFDRERARADRTGNEFSLVVFKPENSGNAYLLTKRILRTIRMTLAHQYKDRLGIQWGALKMRASKTV